MCNKSILGLFVAISFQVYLHFIKKKIVPRSALTPSSLESSNYFSLQEIYKDLAQV